MVSVHHEVSSVMVAVMAAAEIVGALGTYVLIGTLGQRWLNLVLLAAD